MPSLMFGNVALLHDWNQSAQDVLDRYQSLESLVLPPDSSARNDYQNNPVGKNQRIGLPRVEFTERPELKLNSLIWPATFASRFAIGIFLINSEGKAAIEALDCTIAHTLECKTPISPPVPGTDGSEYHVFQAKMHVLAIRRIVGAKGSKCESADAVVSAQDLFLLVLVDYRYFLQFRNIDHPVFDEDCSGYCANGWQEFYQYVADRAGYAAIISEATIKEAYTAVGIDCREFKRWDDNAAVVLDAIAASVGCRLVFPFNGGIAISDGANGRTTLESNLVTVQDQLAGNEIIKQGNKCVLPFANNLPASVEVSFPKSICGQECSDERFVISKSTGSTAGACAVPGTVKTFHSTSYADYPCPTCGGSGYSGGGRSCDMSGYPDNYAALNALATQIAADFISLSYYRYDLTFSSPQPWVPCAYDDWIIVKFGTEWQYDLEAGTEIENGAGGDAAHTVLMKQFWRDHQVRVQSLTYNAFPNSLLHGSTVGVIPDNDKPTWATATECIELCSTGSARLKYRDCTGALVEFDADCVDVIIDNRDCLIYALPGDTFRVEKPCGSQCWYPAERFGLQRGARVEDCVPCGATGLARFWRVPDSMCGNGSGGGVGSCDTEQTDCVVEFSNSSGRVLGCLGPEEVEIAVAPGSCCWWISGFKYLPTDVLATLVDPLCPTGGSGGDVRITGAEFIGGCDGGFTPPTTVSNPLGLAGCEGKKILAKLKLTDCDCDWIITQVEPEYEDITKDVKLQCNEIAEGCGANLKKKLLKQVAIWSCDPTVCDDTVEWEDAGTLDAEEITVQVDTDADCVGSGGCGGVTLTYKTFCVLCPGEITTTTDTIPFTSKTFLTAVSGTDGGCGSGGDCAITYQAVTLCGLWCESSTTSGVAFTLTPVEVLVPPSGAYCDCDGLTLGRQTIMAMCVCEPEDEIVMAFRTQKVYEEFAPATSNDPPAGSGCSCWVYWNGTTWDVGVSCGGGFVADLDCAEGTCILPPDPPEGTLIGHVQKALCEPVGGNGSAPPPVKNCSIAGRWRNIMVPNCGCADETTGETPIIEAENIVLVTEITCENGCPSWTYTAVCVLSVGEITADAGCECTDCPTGLGSGA